MKSLPDKSIKLLLYAPCVFYLCLSIGCFHPPLKKNFKYYNLKPDTSKLNFNGFYTCSGIYGGVEVFKFEENGEASFVPFGGHDFRTQDYVYHINHTKYLNKHPKRCKNSQGYFYLNNDTIKMEISTGDGITGYYYAFFAGILIDKNTFVLNSVYSTKYHVQLSDRNNKKDSITYKPSKIFRFRGF